MKRQVNIYINVKGASRKITTIRYEYDYADGEEITVGDFLDETVRITLEHFKKAPHQEKETETGDQDFIEDKADCLVPLLRLLGEEEVRERAETGKVSFGVHYNQKEISLRAARENARQCFADGLVALFVNGERYEQLTDVLAIRADSEVTFVRLTFLAGRMW